MDYLTIGRLTLYYLLCPIYLVLKWVAVFLLTVAVPVVHLGWYILSSCLWPLRFMARFETLFVFVGVACLVGFLTGTGLHFISIFLAAMTSLKAQREEEPRGRTMASYRARRSAKHRDKNGPSPVPESTALPKAEEAFRIELPGLLERGKAPGVRSLLTSTILEEDDSSGAGF